MISAKIIKHSSYQGSEMISIETKSPKFLDAECITGDTELHFEMLAGKNNLSEYCLAKRTVKDIFLRFNKGVTKSVKLKYDLSKIEDDVFYSITEIAKLVNKTPENIFYFRKKYSDFPAVKQSKKWVIQGKLFKDWCNKNKKYKSKHKSITGNMRLRCMDISTGTKTNTKIIDIWESGYKKILSISCGESSIKCSENHLFYTQNGWVKAKDLSVSKDKIYMINNIGKNIPPVNYLSFNRCIKKDVLKEQNYLCEDCKTNIDKHSADIHHVLPVIDYPDRAFDINNVIALCESCHTKRHKQLNTHKLQPRLRQITEIKKLGKEMTYDLQVAHKDSNFIANGFVVHNCEKHGMISSNSSSSRAIPFNKILEQNPYLPKDVRHNQKGMQGETQIDRNTLIQFHGELIAIYRNSCESLKFLNETHNIHKQHLNRYLEPFTMQTKIMTSTKPEWDYFFSLRLHEAADPNIYELAKQIKEAINSSQPQILDLGEWHLPYVDDITDTETDLKRSVARCARTSYKLHDGSPTTVEQDLELFDRLTQSNPQHLSPLDHQATPINSAHARFRTKGITHMFRDGSFGSGNFKNWIQYRHWYLQGEAQ